jgi:hypothetical protein
MTRRSLIRRLLVILGLDGLGLTGCLSGRSTDRVSPPLPAALEPAAESSALSRAETEDIVAFGEVLVEGGTLSPTERCHLVEYVQGRAVQSPEYLALYRTTVSTLQRLAGQRFALLPVPERLEVISRYGLDPLRLSLGANPDPFPTDMRALRRQVVPDLISGYYGSPAGWAVVDYHIFPGRCGDLTRYTRAEP